MNFLIESRGKTYFAALTKAIISLNFIRFSKLTCWFVFLPFTLFAQAPAAQRPSELWAYRSVLDGVPRVLTLALHADLFVGYDTYHCGITKIWKDGVVKIGAVYNQKHGPQPLSKGGKYLNLPLTESAWFVLPTSGTKGKEKNCKVQFKGYRFENGKIALRYLLKIDSLTEAEVEEWPEYKDGTTGPILERYFKWLKPPPKELDVFVSIASDGLANPESLTSNSAFIIRSRVEKLTLSKPIWAMNGLLKIRTDGPTFVQVLLDPAAIL
jgi:cytochrome c